MRTDTRLRPDLFEIFFPHAHHRHQMMRAEGKDFAIYTSVSNALRILRNGELTLRKSALVNRFSEIEHGARCVEAGQRGGPEDQALNTMFFQRMRHFGKDILQRVTNEYTRTQHLRKNETYILSLTEHDDTREGQCGRLCLWRDQEDRQDRIALVLNADPFLTQSQANLGLLTPMIYCDIRDYRKHFRLFMQHLIDRSDALQRMKPDLIVDMMCRAFNTASLATKHPGLADEQEWRIIYTPWVEWSHQMTQEVIDIADIPQRVAKIKLADLPEFGLIGLKPSDLIKKVIIGPTDHSQDIAEQIADALTQAGFANAASRIVISDIPRRSQPHVSA